MSEIAAHFYCPQCAAEYRVVKAQSDAEPVPRRVECVVCDFQLDGRENGRVLKYFLIKEGK